PAGDIARLIEEAECGASFSKGDAVGVADFISKLAADHPLRARLGANARAFSCQALPREQRMLEWRGLVSELQGAHPTDPQSQPDAIHIPSGAARPYFFRQSRAARRLAAADKSARDTVAKRQ
ncbi:MAG: hypothetical protein CFE32_18570, partial [Alphaproteobacteria bacterium PA3]